MFDHVGFHVQNLAESDSFYRLLLQSLGYEVIFTKEQCIAYRQNGVPIFEIYIGKQPSRNVHIAFKASSKQIVELFHSTGLFLGAQDNGVPGYRDYAPGYYAAFIIDKNGHNLEAVYWDI